MTVFPAWVLLYWSRVLGGLALLDFVAAMLHRHAAENSSWIEDHRFYFGFLFSLAWFLDAFVEAREEGKERPKDYVRSVVIQLLLLPVGFYAMSAELVFVGHRHKGIIEWVGQDDEEDDHRFLTSANACLAFCWVKFVFVVLSRRFGYHVRRHVRHSLWHTARRLLGQAVRNPRQFYRKVRKWLAVGRWILYLAPLVGATNKLLANVVALNQRYWQHRRAEAAKKARLAYWQTLPPDKLREHCAILIQKTYRAHRAKKYVQALNLILLQKETMAALKLQRVFRGSLGRARARLRRKQEQLQWLWKQKLKLKQLNAADRRRMYQLQQEIRAEAKRLLNRKLLLRPDSRFAIVWKALFVAAVILEITQLALRTGKSFDFEDYVNDGVRSFTYGACVPAEPDAYEPAKFFWSRPRLVEPVELPWYCDTVDHALDASEFLLHHFLNFFGLVCFLDVFLTFFTGRINPKTGRMEPPPWFQRWVVPGLVLQLLLNPRMDATAAAVVRVAEGMIRLGPVRVVRWTIALFYPLLLATVTVVRIQWLRFVKRQNQRKVESVN